MPTIDQLAPATATSDTDEVIVNQTGITRRATRAQLLAGVQAELTLPSGTVLGRASPGVGQFETLVVGANLELNSGTLAATAASYSISQSATGTIPAATDFVAVGQGGTNASVTLSQLASGIFSLPGLNASNLIIQAQTSSPGEPLGTAIAGLIASAGGTMTGPLLLADDPTLPLGAATKEYVDHSIGTMLPLSGGTLTGPLQLAENPIAPLHAATKQYVDSQAAGVAALPLSGGTLTGPLDLAGLPSSPDEAASKSYVDLSVATAVPLSGGTITGNLALEAVPSLPVHAVPKSYVDSAIRNALPVVGGTMAGSLILAHDPLLSLEAATKEYVDAGVASALSLAGGTLTGALFLQSNPALPLQAATKQYVDSQMAGPAALPLSGGTLTGALMLAADPTVALQAATKHYVDAADSLLLPASGGTLTGALTLAGNPTAPLNAAPKQYVDTVAASNLALSGGTLTGELVLGAAPATPMAATTKEYVDNALAAVLPLAGGTLTGMLALSASPTAAADAATKGYVDTQVATLLPLSGGSLSGSLLLAGAPVQPLQAASKGYVDAMASSSLALAGGTMSGPLTLSGTPTSPLSASTKGYVDAVAATLLPLSGGSLTGALTLSGDPVQVLQPATKQYVDSATSHLLGLGGGTLSGALAVAELSVGGSITAAGTIIGGSVAVSQIGSQAQTLAAQIGLSRSGSGPTDAPVIESNLVVTHSGGGGLSYSNLALTTTVDDAVNATGGFLDGTLSDVYAFISNLNVNAVTGSGATSTESQHVAVTAATTKKVPPGGYPSGRTGAQVWGMWVPVVDGTNLPSSVSGATTGVELDANANNTDPSNDRKAFQFVLNEAVPLASGGVPAEWAYGIYFTTSPTSYYKFQISAGGFYSIAVLDTRNAFAGTAKVTVGLTAPSTTLAVDPALPFTSAGVYGLPVSSTNAAQTRVGATIYTQVGCTLDGGGKTSGVLTFTTPVSVADGALGSQVVGDSRTIWMATGQQIALDYAGTANLLYDVATSGPHLTSSLYIDGPVNAPAGIVAGSIQSSGTAQVTGLLTASGGLSVAGSYLSLPSYTVASLPSAPNGAMAYATNGRKPWEGAGSGTGVLVWVSTNRWLSALSGTQVLS
ncbi:MAG: hypothetical protein ACP5NP_00375 [Acetobacteraceae bacterium]